MTSTCGRLRMTATARNEVFIWHLKRSRRTPGTENLKPGKLRLCLPGTSKPPESKKGLWIPCGPGTSAGERKKKRPAVCPRNPVPGAVRKWNRVIFTPAGIKSTGPPAGRILRPFFSALFSATGFRSTTRDGGPPARPPGSAGTAKKWSSICQRTLFPLQRLIRMMNYERKILNGSALLQIRRDGVQQVR